MRQRRTNQATMSSGVRSRSVHRSACAGASGFFGSRISTHRRGNDGKAAVAPHGGGRGDLEVARSAAVPVLDPQRFPDRGRIGRHRGQGRQPFPGLARAPSGARGARWRRVVERRIEAQAGDDGEPSTLQGIEEEERREAAVGHEDEITAGQPAACLYGELSAEVEKRLVPAPLGLVEPLGVHERGQERQALRSPLQPASRVGASGFLRPDAPRPGGGGEQHQADPTQAAGLDDLTLSLSKEAARRADRVAVDAPRADAWSPPPLDRIVEADDHRAARRKRPHQMAEQEAAPLPCAPWRPAQNAVEVGEVPVAGVAGDPQHARHRAPPRSQDGADQQHLGMQPGALDEERREGDDQRGETGGSGMVVSLGGNAVSLDPSRASSTLPDPQPIGQSRAECLRGGLRTPMHRPPQGATPPEALAYDAALWSCHLAQDMSP